MKHSLLFVVALVIGCSANVEPPQDEPSAPAACFAHPAALFMYGGFSCNPQAADTCAFDAKNKPTPLDGSGAPLAYYCTCSADGFYSCWGSPGFETAEPLPAASCNPGSMDVQLVTTPVDFDAGPSCTEMTNEGPGAGRQWCCWKGARTNANLQQ